MAEVLHLRPADIDALTAFEFDQAVQYLQKRAEDDGGHH